MGALPNLTLPGQAARAFASALARIAAMLAA
jgi:hypothetical protein